MSDIKRRNLSKILTHFFKKILNFEIFLNRIQYESKISKKNSKSICLLCGKDDTIANITIPYVLKYLVAELASVNIRVNFDTSQIKLTNFKEAK